MALTAQLTYDGRGAARDVLDVDGTLRRASDTPLDVIVEDLSATGFRLRTEVRLTIRETVTIGIPGIGRRLAYVVRATETGVGCEFAEPIDARLVSMPPTAQTVVSGAFEDRLDADLVRRWSAAHPPHVDPLSRSARLLLVAALGVVGWAGVVAVIQLL